MARRAHTVDRQEQSGHRCDGSVDERSSDPMAVKEANRTSSVEAAVESLGVSRAQSDQVATALALFAVSRFGAGACGDA